MADDDLRRREAEVASKEKQLKEYGLMKGEWASLKSKVASADTRLASANKELESKETYIRCVKEFIYTSLSSRGGLNMPDLFLNLCVDSMMVVTQ